MKPPSAAETVTVTDEEAGQRLDNFLLRRLKGVPRTHVYRLLRTGQVRVNKGRVGPDRRLAQGDQVRLPPVRMADPQSPRRPPDALLERLAARIVFEDEHLLVIDKPAGIAAHGGSGVSFGVIETLRALKPECRSLELVHRLDRDTSGLLIVAKKRSALRALHAQMREGKVGKHYLALLAGFWKGGVRHVNLSLAKQRPQGGERVTRVDPEGQRALSIFTPLRRFRDAVLVDVEIRTGRMHQIRVHGAAIGHPVLGDDKYGNRDTNRVFRARGLKRMFLHAAKLRFDHPAADSTLEVSAPTDPELLGLLETLEETRQREALGEA